MGFIQSILELQTCQELSALVELRLLIDRVKSTPRLPGIEEIRITSERSFHVRALNLIEGIKIDRSIHDALQVMASSKG